MSRAEFEIAPGLSLSVSGTSADVRHFRAEYGALRTGLQGGVDPALVIEFGPIPRSGSSNAAAGSHKTVAWELELSPPADAPVHGRISLHGQPRSFARSLVQGYLVEPLLSIIAAERGLVLLPAAGIVDSRGLHMLVGRSRAGKSTLAARALVAGGQIIGDDQVVVTADGDFRPFPRRLRLYPDIREAAPTVWRRLRARTRAVLTGRRLLELGTRGFIRPSLAVDLTELGGRWDAGPRRAARIVLLERIANVDAVDVRAASAADAVAWGRTLLREQRARLASMLSPEWAARLAIVEAREQEILAHSMSGVPIEHIRLPVHWAAPLAVESASRALGLGRTGPSLPERRARQRQGG